MNYNISVVCNTCQTRTNCRLGLSNRHTHPFRFRCKECGLPIDITMTPNIETLAVDIQVAGASQIQSEFFDPKDNFVDLHLDLPVTFEPYIPGNTAFLNAVRRVGIDAIQVHKFRMNLLAILHDSLADIKAILTLYSNDKGSLFRTKVMAFLETDMPCDTQLDKNRALFFALEKAFSPFAEPVRNYEATTLFTETLCELERRNRASFQCFINAVVSSKFLDNVLRDCLEIYPRILDLELLFRPALFLDLDEGSKATVVPYRISSHEFYEVKDMFKDISEIISRLLILVAGVNNLCKRGGHDSFAVTQNAPKDLIAFADLPLGAKLNHIDDSWYEIEEGIVDNHLRNSIAHYRAEYNDVTQVISYFPKREGIRQEQGLELTFLEFARKLLEAFREMHRLNHLTKCIYVYYYLHIKDVKGTAVPETFTGYFT